MKSHLLSVALIAAVVFLSPPANAQGCGQRPNIVMHIYCQQTGGYCYDQECVDGGRDSDYCYEGYGECCSEQITTANEVCDVEECCRGGGDCGVGCEANRLIGNTARQIGSSNSMIGSTCSAGPAVRRGKSLFEVLIDDRLDIWKGFSGSD